MIGAVIIILSSIVIVGFLVNNYLLNKKHAGCPAGFLLSGLNK